MRRSKATLFVGGLLLAGCLDLEEAAYQFTLPEPVVDAGFDAGPADAGFDAGVPPAVLLNAQTGRNRLAAGHDHACAVMSDAGVVCWGANSEGQVDWQSTTTAFLGPSYNVGGPATAVACGEHHTCTINGPTVHCWGSNRFKQMGNPDPVLYRHADHTFQLEPGAPAVRVMAGKEFSCVVNTKKDLLCWGQARSFTSSATAAPTHVPTTVGVATTAASAGYSHVCFVSNAVAQCRMGGTTPQSPVPAFAPAPAEVFAGDQLSTCFVLDGGVQCQSFKKSCWLGSVPADAGYDYSWFPLELPAPPVSMSLAIHNWTDKTDSSCWADTLGDVWCLGTPSLPGLATSCTPVKVALPAGAVFVHVVTGERFACALSAVGDVFCWGDGRYLLPLSTSPTLLPPALMMNIER